MVLPVATQLSLSDPSLCWSLLPTDVSLMPNCAFAKSASLMVRLHVAVSVTLYTSSLLMPGGGCTTSASPPHCTFTYKAGSRP